MGWITVGVSEDFAIHAALLHTGRNGQILLLGGDQHDPVRSRRHDIAHTRVFDCATRLTLGPPPRSPTHDVFCCGQALGGDGRLFIAGGTESFWEFATDIHKNHEHFTGVRTADLFDPELQMWASVPLMAHGRWYPTVLTLATGQMLVLGGHTDGAEDPRHANNRCEIYRPASNDWVQGVSHGPPDNPWLFPRMFSLPDETVFVASPVPLHEGSPPRPLPSSIYNPTKDQWVDLPEAEVPPGYQNYQTSAVLLPLTLETRYRARVLMTGREDALLIDLSAAKPAWQVSKRRWPGGTAPPRLHGHAVLLPTGDVFVCGGVINEADYAQGAVDTMRPELYTPGSLSPSGTDPYASGPGSWRRLEQSAPHVRGYHSTALLMPDGGVWVSGSQYPATKYSFHDEIRIPFDERGPDGDGLAPSGAPIRNLDLTIDIYEPDYMHRARPSISVAPAAIRCGTHFTVYSPEAEAIKRVVLIRAGSVTHAFNSDQRYVELMVVNKTSQALTIAAPPDEGIAPPGYYMLFLIDGVGTNSTPSVATFVRVLPRIGVRPVKINIIEAVYGALEGSLDATETVQKLIDGGASEISVSNATFGDPASGSFKHFGMIYEVEDDRTKRSVRRAAAAQEGESVKINRVLEHQTNIIIIGATYGTVRSALDITAIVQGYVDRGFTQILAGDYLGDPDYGTVKHLAVKYQVGGTLPQVAACQEGQIIELH